MLIYMILTNRHGARHEGDADRRGEVQRQPRAGRKKGLPGAQQAEGLRHFAR